MTILPSVENEEIALGNQDIRRAGVESDHHLVLADIRLRIMSIGG